MAKPQKSCEAIVIGASAGGFIALSMLLEALSADYSLPIMIVQHRLRNSSELFEQLLQGKCRIRIKQAEEKEKIEASCVYIAPPDYHLLVEMDRTLSLSTDALVRFSRPSIDVLFESAAIAYGDKLIAIILTGANDDGADGIADIGRRGGLTIAQDPGEADYPSMVKAAITTNRINHIWPLATIREFLVSLHQT